MYLATQALCLVSFDLRVQIEELIARIMSSSQSAPPCSHRRSVCNSQSEESAAMCVSCVMNNPNITSHPPSSSSLKDNTLRNP
mmetsp:Transcript_69153/g.112272  ORF Transcript_69153/g.112272 Transcript_69153/m.112272 type:complete len:83 (-) Transcript_69153:218-466(-)